eukprot:7431409-Lingulodinium_polyedra.AAC.1
MGRANRDTRATATMPRAIASMADQLVAETALRCIRERAALLRRHLARGFSHSARRPPCGGRR